MSSSSFAALRRFAKTPQQPVLERCELCNLVLPPTHRHLLDMQSRQVACSCDPCALLFQNAAGAKFKIIPRDAHALPDFQMTDPEWESLALPIDLAFFFYNTPQGKMTAMYPSPAGPTESLLTLTAWETLVSRNPALAKMETDVEALLVNRAGASREYFLAPIDKCYELVGTIRVHWRGLSGGDEVWRAIADYFARLRSEARGMTKSE
ncbi:MAG: DUF5947 family protein [Chthoniobacterales bacterium]